MKMARIAGGFFAVQSVSHLSTMQSAMYPKVQPMNRACGRLSKSRSRYCPKCRLFAARRKMPSIMCRTPTMIESFILKDVK